MRSVIAAVLVLVGAACKSDETPQWLMVEERVELCAAAPYSQPLDRVPATQWQFGIEVGEYEVPAAQPLRQHSVIQGYARSPLPPLLDVRDVDDANPFDAALEAAVVGRADAQLQPDDEHDVLFGWSWVDSLGGESGSWLLSLTIETEAGDDFQGDGVRDVHFACVEDLILDPCPRRSFDLCDPGGATIRTRVALDRGEVALDVRYVERDPINGDPHHVMFVASDVHVDALAVVQSDFFRLLHSANDSEIGDGSYAVLAPETFEPAGLGCGIAVADIGTEAPRAFTVDCALHELEPLAVVEIRREVLP